MNELYNTIILDEQERRQAVIDYIANHPGTTLARMDRLEDQDRGRIPGHVKLSNIIKDLKTEGIIYAEKSEGNKRDKPLFVKDNSPFVTTPKEIDEFEELFSSFIRKVVERQSSFVHFPSCTLDECIEQYKEHLGKHKNESLTWGELEEMPLDAELHTELDLMSLNVSPVLKAIQIFDEFMRIYNSRFIVEWPVVISDKKILSKLVALALSKISKLQAQIMEMINPLLQTFYEYTRIPLRISEGSIDSDELLKYYKYFHLETEVKPVLRYLSKIASSNPLKQNLVLPLEKWGIISPSEAGLDTLRELYDPEEYYEEQLGEEKWAILKQSMSEDNFKRST